MAMGATLGLQGGSTILAYGGRNASNSIYRSSILPAVAGMAPGLTQYANNLHARAPTKLLLRVDDAMTEAAQSTMP